MISCLMTYFNDSISYVVYYIISSFFIQENIVEEFSEYLKVIFFPPLPQLITQQPSYNFFLIDHELPS